MRHSAALLTCAALAACGQPEPASPSKPAPAAATGPETTYFCDDRRVVRASYGPEGAAVVSIDGVPSALKIARSASGARYVGEGLQWWTEGMDRGRLSRRAPGEEVAVDPGVNCSTLDAPVEPPAPGQPGGLPDDRTPVSEGIFAPESAQGAANVVQVYYANLGQQRYAEAWKSWADGGRASGATQQQFAAGFAAYRSYHAQVGAPGVVEGAAGSLYVEVPVVIYGRLAEGFELHQAGKVGLKRANDVPGATAEQRSWRIVRIDLSP